MLVSVDLVKIQISKFADKINHLKLRHSKFQIKLPKIKMKKCIL